LILLTALLSMNIGFIRLPPLDLLKTLLGTGTERQRLILFDFRLPRIVIAVLIGMGLAAASAILQGLSLNGLADSGVLGINTGAGCMVVLYLLVLRSATVKHPLLLPFMAFAGGIASAALICFLACRKGRGLPGSRILLTGIGVNLGLGAFMAVLTIRMDPQLYDFVIRWFSGTIWGVNWKFVLALLPWLLALIPFALYQAESLDILSLGDPAALGLGLNIEREKLKLLLVSVALSSSCVAVGGGMCIVGLHAPHIARRFNGAIDIRVIPAAAMIGGVLVLGADTAARFIFSPREIPAGIAVSFFGAPYFLYRMTKSRD
jgi:iron complex transport system permease protein